MCSSSILLTWFALAHTRNTSCVEIITTQWPRYFGLLNLVTTQRPQCCGLLTSVTTQRPQCFGLLHSVTTQRPQRFGLLNSVTTQRSQSFGLLNSQQPKDNTVHNRIEMPAHLRCYLKSLHPHNLRHSKPHFCICKRTKESDVCNLIKIPMHKHQHTAKFFRTKTHLTVLMMPLVGMNGPTVCSINAGSCLQNKSSWPLTTCTHPFSDALCQYTANLTTEYYDYR